MTDDLDYLSNTATPEFYGEFRDAVSRGDIPVNREVSLQMNRIDSRIEDPKYYYDPRPTRGFIRYCENEMTLTDGTDLKLLPSFKLWAEDLLGWYYFVIEEVYQPPSPIFRGGMVSKQIKKRLTLKQYLIVARGSAKSMYASCIQSYFLNVDPETTHCITTAPTMKQADEVLSPIRTAILRARGPLFQFLTEGSLSNTTGPKAMRQKLSPTKKGIENFLTGSSLEIRPMSVDKLQGARPKVSTIDEWLSGEVREDVVAALEQGASKLDDYVIVAISSEGTVRNGSGDTIKLELAGILKGDSEQPQVSIWHYKLDEVEEVGDPTKWPKANPNIGLTVGYDTYHRDVVRMENAPASRNDILAKRFGLPMESYSYFFSYDEIQPLNRKQNFNGMLCSLGADLSHGDDFCAFTFLFPMTNGSFGIKTRSYITDMTHRQLPAAMRQKYQEFIDEGSLIIMDAAILDMMDVYDDLEVYIDEHEYDVTTFGYDPYNAAEFVKRYVTDYGPGGVEKVIQGVRTESVPLGELKNLSEAGLLLFDENLMTFAMANAITIEDTNGNRKLLKRRHEEKIDNVAALMDAFVAYKLNKDAFD